MLDQYRHFIDYIMNIYEELPRGDLQAMVEAEVLKTAKDKTPKEQIQIADKILTEIDNAIYEIDRDITLDWTK